MNTQPCPRAVGVLASTVSCIISAGSLAAGTTGELAAHWRAQQVRLQYHGFTSAYDCDALADKVADILQILGAHPATRVSGAGCAAGRPSRTVTLQILTALPAPAAGPLEPNQQQLLQQLGVPASQGSFSARWDTVELAAADRRLQLQPGDCELIEQVGKELLPQLGMEVVEQNTPCIPREVPLTRPTLTVRTLIASQSAAVDRSSTR
jgi:hypothetical protein